MYEEIPSSLIEATKAFNAELERLLATVPAVNVLGAAETRRLRREGRGLFPAPEFVPQARTVTLPGPAGEVSLRVIAPEPGSLAGRPPAGVFLHIHGGGWTIGENDMQDPRLARLAADTGLVVASVAYRLAPEHPYPAGPDDCETAARWLLEHRSELGVAADAPLAIGGDSAGAQLSAVTLLRLRDRDGDTGDYVAAVYQYGGFDLSLTPSQRNWGERNLVLSTPIIRWFGDQFVPAHSLEERRHPDISPLYADLAGLPPAIFTVGTADPLIDDTLFMYDRYRLAGIPCELRVWPEAPHGFLSLPMGIAEPALAAEHAFLRRTLGA